MCSRATVILWAALCAYIASPYDSSNSILRDIDSDGTLTHLDNYVDRLVGHLGNWDGVYFIEIARVGYTTEKELVFFPGLPVCIAVMRYFLIPLEAIGLWHARSSLLICAVTLNAIVFIIAALLLEQLGRALLKQRSFARYAALLFCISPVGIFMSAVYSESLFAMLSFAGMLFLVDEHRVFGNKHLFDEAERRAAADSANATPTETTLQRMLHFLFRISCASVCFACASAVRSNGIVLAGYIVWATAAAEARRRRDVPAYTSLVVEIMWWIFFWSCAALAVAVMFAPFVAFQWYGHFRFCTPAPDRLRNALTAMLSLGSDVVAAALPRVLPQPPPTWCSLSDGLPPMSLGDVLTSPVPRVYARLQAAHWGVGPLFAYWTWAHLPHFIMAVPAVALAASALYRILRSSSCAGRDMLNRSAFMRSTLTPLVATLFPRVCQQRLRSLECRMLANGDSIDPHDCAHAASSTTRTLRSMQRSSSSRRRRRSRSTRHVHQQGTATSEVDGSNIPVLERDTLIASHRRRFHSPVTQRRGPSYASRSESQSRCAQGQLSDDADVSEVKAAAVPQCTALYIGREALPHTLPYAIHWFVLVAIASVVMHVQVVTRLVAACPMLYWHATALLLDDAHEDYVDKRLSRRRFISVLIVAYCVGYTLVGTALFSSFYNWT